MVAHREKYDICIDSCTRIHIARLQKVRWPVHDSSMYIFFSKLHKLEQNELVINSLALK